jgi:membrane protein required for colicin V production
LIFLVVLIVVHLITSRISDTVLDSRVGAIDRILGLAFGFARGFVLVVIPFMFYEAFVDKPEQQYPWVRDAVSRPYIKSTGDSLRIILQRLVPSSLMGPEQQQGLLLQQDNSSVARAGGKRVRVVLYRGGPARTNT